MDLYGVLDQIVELLRQRGQVTYRLLKLHFKLDDETLEALKDELEMGPDSTLLCFNTEGATDPVNYQEIVWHGKYPSIA